MTTLGLRARQSGWLAVIAGGILLTGIFYLLPAGTFEQSVVYDIVGIGVVAAAVVGVALHRPQGAAAWLLIAAGQLAFVVGDILWTTFSALGEDPFPSIADVAYLAAYPLIAAGLAVAVRRRIAGGDRAGLLDAAILATGAGIVWWAIVLGPLAASADPAPLPFAISVAYPAGDLLLIGMALALAVTPGAKGASFRLLIANLATVLVADLVFGLQTVEGTYVNGGLLDGIWLIGYVLFGAAAMHPSMAELVEPRPVLVTLLGPVRMCLLGAAMLVGPALLMLQQSRRDAVLVVVATATALLSVLALARLAGMVRHLARDIERRKALEEQLAFQAFHDPLTGLANRRRFIAAVSDALRSPAPLAALFVDLDDFKHVNDNSGHDAGDALLLAVGERLLAAIRPGDIVGRLGGDEFAVLLREADAGVAESVATRLGQALSQPLEIQGEAVVTSASIGLALRDAGEATAVDDLLRWADVAMYHAKARGKNCWAAYTPEMSESFKPSLVGRPASAA